jgi:hypothetical protein
MFRMSTSTKKMQTLVGKLAQIMADTPWVEKKGRNAFFNYDYAKEADIMDAVREKLAEHGVFVFTSVENMEFRETSKKTRDGSPVNLVFVKTRHTFSDGDSGESIEVFGYGCGEDSGDKAIYKAITGAMKYFVSKNFLMSTGDDPEKDEEKDEKVQSAGQGSAAQAGAVEEAPSYTPVPHYRGSPSQSASPSFENPARDYIKDIQSKSGPKKDGTTYTRYSIETRNNGFFTTFNPAFADIALEAKNSGQEVVIGYRANGRWKDIENIQVAGLQPAGVGQEVETLPF